MPAPRTLQIDNVDRLPPHGAPDTPPWAHPLPPRQFDWAAILALGGVGTVLLLVGYWLFGHDVRWYLTYGDGAWIGVWLPKLMLATALAFVVKRWWLIRQPGGFEAPWIAISGPEVVRGVLSVHQTHAATAFKQVAAYTHTEGSAAPQISTTINPDIIDATPVAALTVSDIGLLRDWKARKLICQSENTLLLGFDKGMGSIDPSSGMYLQLGEKSDAALLAVSGDSGGGKTSTMRFLLAQAAMNGSQLVLCDPHGRHNEQSLIQSCGPLAASYLIDPALSWDDIHSAVAAVDAIGRSRIDHGGPMPHIVLVLDEFNDIACNAPDFKKIADLLKNIARSYRKVNITALLVIHNWRVSEWQDSTLRDAVQGALFHKMAKGEAQLYINDMSYSKQIAFLPHGDAMYFKRGQPQPTRLTGIPFVPKEELERARDLFVPVTRYVAPTLPDARPVVSAATAASATVRASVPGAIVYPDGIETTKQRIAVLLLRKYSYREIARELRVSHETISNVSAILQAHKTKNVSGAT